MTAGEHALRCADALATEAPLRWDGAPGNLSYRFERGDRAAVEAVLAEAAYVVEIELVNNRLVVAPIEPRGFRLPGNRCPLARR